ncbi:GAF domain-containing sensor histidine kinase, partial [bacterium]|nr:GAF domain-containing sensor histidine kinase [bacterium]
RRASSSLQEKLDEMETLAGLGRTITGTLDLDTILASVVEAAVGLTGAEEGSLLMLDAASGELYMRAARNFQDDFVRTFRMPVQDSLVSSVLQSGSPVLINEQTPQKIKTSYLVHSLIYVPLKVKNQIIGVLGVDNRLQRQSFQEHDVKILSAVAEYAVIAIENAHLYEATNIERRKLETILGSIEDGVIVLDQDQRLLMANGQIQNSFALQDQPWQGHRYEEFFVQEDMQALIENDLGTRAEVSLADGRIFDGLAVSIPEVGTVVTLHDITYLKKLDRIKSEFVNTVSHDLRSPLTAIMGYVELIERAGPVNELQKEFVRRVMGSVVNITRLVDDLLNLGRIEAGFDVRKDNIQMETLINLSID